LVVKPTASAATAVAHLEYCRAFSTEGTRCASMGLLTRANITCGSTMRYSTVQYSTVQCGTVQYNMVQNGVLHYREVQYRCMAAVAVWDCVVLVC
jgi:hypothetical protein